METYFQQKEEAKLFLNQAMRSFEVIAPVKTDLVRFQKINSPEEIFLEKNSYFPAKEFFFKKEEVLFTFSSGQVATPRINVSPRIFFGLRKCDLNAIMRQDMVFIKDAKDPFYTAARENSYLIGYHCEKPPSKYCFCGSLDLVDFFDLMYYDMGDYFIVEVGSEKGRFLVRKFKKHFSKYHRKLTQEERKIRGTDRLFSKDISPFFDNPAWDEGVSKCLSCAACTTLCPTCYCFEIHDEVSSKDAEKGRRKRSWSSCMLHSFTQVTGNHVFRKKREERFKHRIYHQLSYFKKKYGVNLCVGCGRCIEGCPTRIDFVEIVNRMSNETRKSKD